MALFRVGAGLLVIGGAVGVLLVTVALTGATVALGSLEPNGLVVGASCAAIGIGAGALSVARASGLSRLTRFGFGIDACGLVGLAASASANTGPDTSPLLLVLLASMGLTAVGLVATVGGLVWSRGLLRLAGVALAVGAGGVLLHIANGSALSTLLIAGIPLAFATVGLSMLASSTGRDLGRD